MPKQRAVCVYICECGCKIPLKSRDTIFPKDTDVKMKVTLHERDFQENDTSLSISGHCPKCNEEWNVFYTI